MQHEHDDDNRDVTRRRTEMTGARLDLPADDNRFRALDRIDEASSSSGSPDKSPSKHDDHSDGDGTKGDTVGDTDGNTGSSLRRSARTKNRSLVGRESRQYLARYAVDIQYEDGADLPYCELIDRGIHEDLSSRGQPALSAAAAMTPCEHDGWKVAMSCPEAHR